MFIKKSLIAATTAATVCLAQPTFAAAVDDRIAELERQLEELKALVSSQQTSIDENIQSLAVQREEIAEARPIRKGTRFTYGGYVQLDAITSSYSEGKPSALMEDLFVPSLIPVEPVSGSGDAYQSTNIHAKTSRFYFKTETDTDAGKISSHIELDFLLSGQGDERVSNSFASRIRHAFLKWDYAPGKSFLAGQYWSTFFNVGALPDQLDFVGPAATIFERQPMIRWTNGPFQLALENETTRINLPEGGTRLDDSETIPDIVARYNGQSGDLNWSLAAIGRQLSYEARSDANTEVASDEQFGYGLSLSGKWMLGRDDVRFMASYGDALGRYLGLNSFNDGYIDVDGDIGTIDQFGAFLAYRHYWNDQWRSSFTVSASGASNPDIEEFAAANTLAKAYQSVHLNLQYLPAPRLMLGGEIMYGSKELEDGRDGDMYRLQLSAKCRRLHLRPVHRHRHLGACRVHEGLLRRRRRRPPRVNGMATAADWMSAASFISMAGLIAFGGYGGSVFLMGWTGGYVLLALLLAPYLRKFGKFTVPEFIGDRYYSNTARIVAVICLIISPSPT
jgi:hypothetical protein